MDRADFEYVQMDTDSAYIAFSAPSMEDVIRPAKRRDFFQNYAEWFPRRACDIHEADFVETRVAGRVWEQKACCVAASAYDRRKPGLFKVSFSLKNRSIRFSLSLTSSRFRIFLQLEWEGEGVVALNSKFYHA